MNKIQLKIESISSNQALSKIIKNISWLFSEKIIIMALQLLSSIVIARVIGSDSFGKLNYLLALITLIEPLSSLGLNAILMREISKGIPERKVISTILIFRLISIIVSSLFFFYIYTKLSLIDNEDIYLFSIMLAFNTLTAFSFINYWFQYYVKSKVISIMRTLVTIIFVTIKLTCVYLAYDVSYLIFISSLEIGIIGIGFVVCFYMQGRTIRFKYIDFNYGIKLIKSSWWLILSGFASIIYLKIDQIMLGNLIDDSAVGVYAVAAKLSEVWYFIPTAIVASFFSKILSEKKKSDLSYYDYLQKIFILLYLISIVIAVTVTLLADFVVINLYGDEFIMSSMILKIHIWGGIFVFLRALVSKWIIAEDLMYISLLSHGFGAVINVGLNWFVIPEFGAIGAAYSTVIAYIFSSYLCFAIFKKTRVIFFQLTYTFIFPVMILKKVYFKSEIKN